VFTESIKLPYLCYDMYDNEMCAALRQVTLQFITEFFQLKLVNMHFIWQIILYFILTAEVLKV
jgi:hypothetical protein